LPDAPILRGPRVLLRGPRENDIDDLAAILDDPEVARWWGRSDRAEIEELFTSADESIAFVIDVEGEVGGFLQFYEETDAMYRHAGIDLFLGARWRGRGIGTEAIVLAARYLFEERGHHRLTIDPAAANEAAIRLYERIGFRRVGVMRSYERAPDGSWRDGLLMDMLRDDFRPHAGLGRSAFGK
jgi:aminoglycoside 6'-N-acetyltransferase